MASGSRPISVSDRSFRTRLLDPTDVQRGRPEVHLILPQVHQLGRAGAVAESF